MIIDYRCDTAPRGNAYLYAQKVDENDSCPNDGCVESKDIIAGIISGAITKEDCKKAGFNIPDKEYPPQEVIDSHKKIEESKNKLETNRKELKDFEDKVGFWNIAKPSLFCGSAAGIGAKILGFKKAGLIGLGVGAVVGLWAHLGNEHAKSEYRKDVDNSYKEFEDTKAEYNTKYGTEYPHKFI